MKLYIIIKSVDLKHTNKKYLEEIFIDSETLDISTLPLVFSIQYKIGQKLPKNDIFPDRVITQITNKIVND